MVKSSAEYRVEKYLTKREGMTENYQKMVLREKIRIANLGARASVDEKVATILTSYDITGPDRIKYHNFARKIEKLQREGVLTNTALRAERAKYEALGCDPKVLDDIVKAITGTEIV